MTAGFEIRLLRPDELEPAVEMLARAFFEDPGALIIEPNPALRDHALRALFAPVVRWALPFGHVGAAVGPDGRILGVATFVPPGHEAPSEDELEAAGLAEAIAAAPEAAARMEAMTGFLEDRHTAGIDGPHWRLEFFGVDPEAQGGGLGSRLIATGHAQADVAGERVWLETFTAENVRWYERRGYRVVGEAVVPGTTHTLWGLIREPLRPG
jgi:ribosomal protein S18 acetylase RimI-like enzyme